jgi:hypothetical protein
MTKADEFREYADEALQWSSQSKMEEEKMPLLDLAVTGESGGGLTLSSTCVEGGWRCSRGPDNPTRCVGHSKWGPTPASPCTPSATNSQSLFRD